MNDFSDIVTPLTVSLLVRRNDGKILAISRKDDPNDFGLPGGKVDPGETVEEAIKREVLEETGLEIHYVTPIFTRISKGKKVRDGKTTTYLNITFVALSYLNHPKQQEKEGRLAWIPSKLLCCGSFDGICSFVLL